MLLITKRQPGKPAEQAMVISWYDNDWDYANRVLDLILMMESQKPL